jgi:hypothetical protein
MRAPSITKQQTVAALVEMKRQDHSDKYQRYLEEDERLHKAFEAELLSFMSDPQRVAAAITRVEPASYNRVDYHLRNGLQYAGDDNDGVVSINTTTMDPRCAALYKEWRTHQETNPGTFNEVAVRTLLEDKLSGCDPQSLLSVPANVETFRNLMTGLALMPMTVDELKLLDI